MILYVSILSLRTSLSSFLTLLIWALSLFFWMSLTKDLSILFYLFKKLDLCLIFPIFYLYFIYFCCVLYDVFPSNNFEFVYSPLLVPLGVM